jgi:predicted aspartyl protease
MRLLSRLVPLAGLLLTPGLTLANEPTARVAMQEKAAATFYVSAQLGGSGLTEFLVDTGAGYTTINEETLAALTREGGARYLRQLAGTLADGSQRIVPVYAVNRMNIGGNCWLNDVEVAVFPGRSRQLLGLSALRRAAPFTFSVDPPTLELSHCDPAPAG